MPIKIIWTNEAIEDLRLIFNYYSESVSKHIAKKIIDQILLTVNKARHYPKSGPLEPLLEEKMDQYRYIVHGNYKIIYLQKEQKLFIIKVFDTRQNPDKLSF